MKNIPVPSGDYLAEFKALVNRKKSGPDKTTLVAMFASIGARYTEYHTNRFCVEDVSMVERSTAEKQSLKSCYMNSTKLKQGLIGDDGGGHKPTPRCPYCQIDRASTWDHFLPSSKFPDFYVFPKNLIHVCPLCNETKGNRNVVPERKTVHPYFDKLSEMSYLKCTVLGGIELTVHYSINPDATDPNYDVYTARIIEQHFVIYGLARKFRAEAASKIAEFKKEIQFWTQTVSIQLSPEILNKSIDSKINNLVVRGEGPNHWEVALWNGMKGFSNLLETMQE